MSSLFDRMAHRIIALSDKRPPDFVIGEARSPYLRRWYLIPRNPICNIYLHEILRDDEDRALHDHPWENVSIVLLGGYYERTPDDFFWRAPGSVTFRRATALHRLILPVPGRGARHQPACWSLFITGPRRRVWGFACPKGWVPWHEFVDQTDTGNVGRGCGES